MALKRMLLMGLLVLALAVPGWAADVWTYTLDKVQPTWNSESKILVVPVKITVFLNIDAAGAVEYGNQTCSVGVSWGTDVNTCATLLIPKLQDFIDVCKKQRLAWKATAFTTLINTIAAGLII